MQNGPHFTMTIGGKAYTVRPLAVAALTYSDLARYVQSQRVSPLEIATRAIQVTPESQHKNIWDAAIKAAANMEVQPHEVAEFETSIRGYAFKLWRGIKGDHPEVDSIDKALELLLSVSPAEAAEFEAKVKSLKSGSNQ